jgi:hypothetical protein
MTIINLKTGKVRTTEAEPLPKCEICDTDVNEDGMSGNIGMLPISFCGICTIGIVNMLVEKGRNQDE